jgi:hypothetical protein
MLKKAPILVEDNPFSTNAAKKYIFLPFVI